jgi:F0F1-type ATP synthase assembly protein I
MTDISMRTNDSRQSGMDESGSWAVGGMTLVGIGVGFVFLQSSPLLFVASVLVGIGTGLVMAARMSSRRA